MKSPSANAGIHSIRTSIAVNTNALIASPIAGALLIITLHTATTAAVSWSTIDGIRFNIPTIIVVIEATKAVAPAAPAAASVVNPVANIIIPAPAAKQATPSKVIAPLTAKIGKTSGLNTAPAIPTIVNAPAIATKPFTISPHDILPSATITGVNILKAAAITSNAAALVNIPLDKPANKANPAAKANIPPMAAPANLS